MRKISAALIMTITLLSVCTGCGDVENIDVSPAKKAEEAAVSETETTVTFESTEKSSDKKQDAEEKNTEKKDTSSSSDEGAIQTGLSINALDGVWRSDSEYHDYLVFDKGKYRYVSGYTYILKEGTVNIEKSENASDYSCSYVLRDQYSGEVFDSFKATGDVPLCRLETENKEKSSANYSLDENIKKEPSDGDDFTGGWTGPRPWIEIDKKERGYEVRAYWSSNAMEHCIWTYECEYDSASKKLVCSGNGKCINYKHEDDGNCSEELVYSDGSAEFSLEYGILFWNDKKENIGRDTAFIKQ